MKKIKIGILGYGNLGKGVEKAVKENEDIELIGIFTRRDPKKIKARAKVIEAEKIIEWKDRIDVMLLCGGSATDIPEQAPQIIKIFNTVDSFDTHAKIPEYLKQLDEIARNSKKTAIISAGWDPGLFSIQRLYSEAMLPNGKTNTFWGPGVSQGHSEAIRRIEGVEDAVQYTIPKEDAIRKAREQIQELETREKHLRRCYVLTKKDANKQKIEQEIKSMKNYFSNYETEVNFIDKREMKKHKKMPHSGYIIRCGKTEKNNHIMEYRLKLDSNPEFTANVMLSFARATNILYKNKEYGAKTVLDIPPYMLSKNTREQLIKNIL